jgi:hypothetical protein
MGRFTLRDEGHTTAIGEVTKLPKNHYPALPWHAGGCAAPVWRGCRA